MGYKLFIDDERFPITNDWVVARSSEEAMIIAREQGQLFRPEGTHNPNVLYSECLY